MTKETHGVWDDFERDAMRTRQTKNWREKRTWVLKKCSITGDLILPGTKAFCKTYYSSNDDNTPSFSVWVTTEAYLFEKIKGTINQL